MNIHSRKLNLIENMILLNDNAVLSKIEKLLNSVKNQSKKEIEPMSLEEFYQRIEASELAIKNGKIISQNELEKESENW